MAVTGLIMIGFLLMHMYGNLKVFFGAESFDHYAHWLKGDILYPIFPKGWFIWIFRLGMVAVIVLHVYSAMVLWRRAKIANPDTYQAKRRLAQTYSARTMRWGGVILLGGLIFHLLQFTVLAIHVGGDYDVLGPYERMVAAFNVPLLYAAYFISMALLAMHVRHGVWSALATWGFNKKTRTGTINAIAVVVALALFIGFMAPPTAILLGWIV